MAAGSSKSSKELCSDVRVTIRIKQCTSKKISRICKVAKHPEKLKLDEELFTFDQIKWENESQEKVYKAVAYPFVVKALQGFNTTIITFGPAGSGKSYTMGTLSSTEINNWKNNGIIQRCLKHVFEENEIQVSASFVEIKNQELHDLLNMGSVVSSNSSTVAKVERIKSLDEGLQLVNEALQLKKERLTNSSVSLRNISTPQSHTLLTLRLKIADGKNCRKARLNLLDLAGSRIAAQTRSQSRSKVNSYFDESISALNTAIASLSKEFDPKQCDKKTNLLTVILKDLLDVSSHRVSLIGCISPDPSSDCEETLKTLRLAQCVKNTKIQHHVKAASGNLIDKLTPSTEKPTKVLLPESAEAWSIDIKEENIDEAFKTPTKKQTLTKNMKNCRVVTRKIDNPLSATNGENLQGNCRENKSPPKDDENYNINHTKSPLTNIDPCSAETASTLSISRMPTASGGHESPSISKNVSPSASSFDSYDLTYLPDSLSVGSFEDISTLFNPEDPSIIKPEELNNLNVCEIGGLEPEYKSTYQTGEENETVLIKDVSQLSISAEEEETVSPGHNCQDTEKTPSELTRLSSGKEWFDQQPKSSTAKRMQAILTNDPFLPQTSQSGDEEDCTSKVVSIIGSQQMYYAKVNQLKRMNAILTTDFDLPGPSQVEEDHSAKKIVKLDNKIPVLTLNRVPVENLDATTRLSAEGERVDNVENVEKSFKDKQVAHNNNILRILNTYNAVELTALPQVGFKTAVILYQYRLLHGKFRSLEDLKNVPTWTSKSCNKFFAANNLTLE